MPNLRHQLPKYRLHKASGQAVVTLSGRDVYLGPHGSRASRIEFDRIVGEWLANDRCGQPSVDLTISELALRYWKFAQRYYTKDGRPTGAQHGIRVMLKILRKRYATTPAAEFSPLALRSLLGYMVAQGWTRTYINNHVGRIRRLFKWAVANGLLPVTVYQALLTVDGLRKGRTEAREPAPIGPVSDATVEATLPHLPAVVADMVRLQRLTGCRPAEACILRPCDVDTSGEVWRYLPASHKTEHHGKSRVILLGPRAQDVLRPYLLRDKSAYCFAPGESERQRNAERREQRRSPMTPSQARRRPKSNRKRPPGDHYTTESYRRAIERACDKAFPAPDGLDATAARAWQKDHHWAPNRLRHAAATEIRKRYGLEAAQVTLGHASADVSQIYAERDLTLAARVMAEVG